MGQSPNESLFPGSCRPRRGEQAWLKLRQKGFARFVLLNGIVMWGGSMWLFFAAAGEVSLYQLERSVHLPTSVIHQLRIDGLLFAARLTFLAGAIWALITWFFSEWWYVKRRTS
jgi:hypothetical protein